MRPGCRCLELTIAVVSRTTALVFLDHVHPKVISIIQCIAVLLKLSLYNCFLLCLDKFPTQFGKFNRRAHNSVHLLSDGMKIAAEACFLIAPLKLKLRYKFNR